MAHKTQQPVFENLQVEYIRIADLVRNPRNARKHSQSQIAKLRAGIERFGFVIPITIDEANAVIGGHGRLDAGGLAGMEVVPCLRLKHLSPAQKKALAIADNRLAELASWDRDVLVQEFAALEELDFEIELTGFDTAEVDILLETGPEPGRPDPADALADVDPPAAAVSQLGDLWLLDRHRLLCADALEEASYERLLVDEKADAVVSDPPFNVPINGHVSGLGKAAHREFAMASGEMSPAEFTAFLEKFMGLAVQSSVDGSLHLIFMDWRHAGEIMDAGRAAYTEFKALCVWNKTNAGMGSLWRSKHELVFVFKNGKAPHINNVQLGKYGRWRSNVWDYAGANSFRKGRDADLADHPTVKPTAIIADALRDCTKRGALVLDPFAGSGTIFAAAERTKRRAAGMELDPRYVDVAIRRWEGLTGKQAVLAGDGRTFAEIGIARRAPNADVTG